MSENLNNTPPERDQATPRVIEGKPTARRNGSRNGDNGSRSSTGIPGINPRELYEERNWPALAGLGLIGLGFLYLVQDVFDLHFNLWGIILLGIGGFLVADAWQKYDASGRTWTGIARNRLTGGAVIMAIGLLGTFQWDWWAVMLLGLAGWLGYDTWQKYEANGRVWTETMRNRATATAIIGILGLFGMLSSWSIWPLFIIAMGVALVFGVIGQKAR